MALKLVKVKIKRNWNPGGKEKLKKNGFKRHINIAKHHHRGEVRRKEKCEELERNMKEKIIRTVM